jgi:D-cysteine desulfhydrase family pyridoxal phosphate-dependent enzyme
MDAPAVLEALEGQPRRVLGLYPSPLLPLENLGRELGRRLFVKRDDLLGPAGGGNKTRKLENLLAHALDEGATRVVTVGGVQSNHARITAAAARMLGLEPHLLLFGERPERAVGNLLIDELVGAELHFIPPGPLARKPCDFEELDAHVRAEAAQRVEAHYHVPLGGSNGRGALGYVRGAIELEEQAAAAGIGDAWVVLATGSAGTLAGLVLGLRLIGSSLRPLGIDIGGLFRGYPALVTRIAADACRLLGLEPVVNEAEVPVVEGTYVGDGYAVPTPAGDAALRRLARTEGILLDPTYTGKAFAGLLDLAASGHFGADDPVVFWHTGGLPGLFSTHH